MLQLFNLILVTFMFFAVSAQEQIDNYNQCSGAMNVFESGHYKIKFNGHKGTSKAFTNYAAIDGKATNNVIWISFLVPANGTLSLNASSTEKNINMVIFDRIGFDICNDIHDGNAEIKRLIVNSSTNEIGLSKETSKHFLYPLKLDKGQLIDIAFYTEEEAIVDLDLDFRFEFDVEEEEFEEKIIDKRDDDFAPTFSIAVRDKESNRPIIANITLTGIRDVEALYKGSDLFLNLSRGGKIDIQCDAEGYFFFDSTEVGVVNTKDQEIVISLEKVASGKSKQIEGIEFKPGTSEFMPSADAKLRRLRDFLALNSEVNIEIQGHVFAKGDNSMLGQKISEARAKQVMKYLINNGIDKSRMKAEGYGNTKPLFENPKFSYEEQANRRVEIVVL